MARLSFNKGRDDVSESWEWQINACSLFKSGTSCLSFTLSFRSSKIDKIKLSSLDSLITLFISLCCFNINCKNRMTSRWVFIHGSFSCHSVVCSLVHVFFYFCNTFHDTGCQIFDKNSLITVFFQLQLFIKVFSQQVSDILIVNLEIRTSDKKLFLHILCIIKVPEDVIKGIWDDSSLALVSFHTDHGMGFTATGLSVCEDSSVVTIHDGFDQWKSTFIVNSPLIWVFVVNSIIGKTSACVSLLIWGCSKDHLIGSFVNLNTIDTAIIFFFRVHWPNSDHNLNAFATCSHFKNFIVTFNF